MDKHSILPEKIIQWTLSCSFDELSREEQEEVLKFIKEEEYRELHGIQNEIGKQFSDDKSLAVPESLNQRFVAGLNERSQKRRMIPLWKAAAGFLIPLSGWFITLIIQSENQALVNTVHDTIYVSVAKPEIILKHDTVIVYKEKHERKSSATNSNTVVKSNISPGNPVTAGEAGIRIIEKEELEYLLEKRKNPSMAEDSLYHRIGYAGI